MNISRLINSAPTLIAAFLLSGTFAVAETYHPILPFPPPTVSTVPSNGDVNPYGVAFVPRTVPSDAVMKPGDILVSNFNNSQNIQGQGTTIVRISPNGQQSSFFQGTDLGLTAALGILRNGFVLVGSLPANGTPDSAQPGALLVLSPNGVLLGRIVNTNLINGPWGLAIHEQERGAQVFVSNVLTGRIVRFDLIYLPNGIDFRDAVVVGDGFNHRGDPAALELGPSGLAYDAERGVLFVASSADNEVFALPNAEHTDSSLGTGTLIYNDPVHLHGALDLVLAPNGDLIVANSDGSNADPNQPSELVEFTRDGNFVAQFSVDPNNGGAFGVALKDVEGVIRAAAVDDNQNILELFTIFPQQR